MTAPKWCPGSGVPCLYDACYRRTHCRVCGKNVAADNAPTLPGGGRVERHHPAVPGGHSIGRYRA